MQLLDNKILNDMSPSQRKEYYEKVKEYCINQENKQFKFGQELIHKVYPF